jgi:hypothetical protein
VKASTVLRWTRCSWRSRWLSRAASYSTWGGYCGPLEKKTSIEVHDYVDFDVPVLARMHGKRLAAYASLGFDTRHRRSAG